MIEQRIFEQFCDFLAEHMALSFQKGDQKSLEKKILSIVEAFGGTDPTQCLADIMMTPVTETIVSKLAQILSVGETYFFRDRTFFSILEEKIIPELIDRKQNRRLRIWSAGCATGEEAYSIAILLKKSIRDLSNWDIKILGTDINKKFLHKAEKGQYKKWSFRLVEKAIQDRYFEELSDGHWLLVPEIRQMVEFDYFNLADVVCSHPYDKSGGFDLIICNNVLIYFTADKIKQTIEGLSNALLDEGWLCVTPIEVPFVQHIHLIPWNFGNTILFKKSQIPQVRENPHFSLFSVKSSDLLYHDASFAKVAETNFSIREDQQNNPFNFSAEQPPNSQVLESHVEVAHPAENNEVLDPCLELEVLYKRKAYAEVIEKIEKLLLPFEDNLKKMEAHLSYIKILIHAYADQKKLDIALQWCNKALLINNLDPFLHCLQACILQELSREPEAMNSLKSALYLDSNVVIAHFGLGCLHMQRGNTKDAERCFRNALKLLEQCPADAVLPGTDDLLAGNLKSIILSKDKKMK